MTYDQSTLSDADAALDGLMTAVHRLHNAINALQEMRGRMHLGEPYDALEYAITDAEMSLENATLALVRGSRAAARLMTDLRSRQ